MASGYSSFSPQAVSYLCDAENMPLFCNLYNTFKVLRVLPTSRAKIIWAVCLEVHWSAFKLITCTFTVQVPETFKVVAVIQCPCPSWLYFESHICFIYSDEKCYQQNEIGTQLKHFFLVPLQGCGGCHYTDPKCAFSAFFPDASNDCF